MFDDAIERYFIRNGSVENTLELDKSLHANTLSVYEVIRVKEGIPLFLEQHIERLISSAKILGYDINYMEDVIIDSIHKLIDMNNKPEKNIRLVISNIKDDKRTYFVCFIKSNYPTLEQYEKGVHTVTYSIQRKNPNAKVVNDDFKSKVNEVMRSEGAYEIILLNEHMEITEGSRSNLFFIKGSTVYTSPLKNVLGGVTRTNVISICKQSNINVEESVIHEDFLDEIDALFMTGTSPKVLPISSVGDKKYTSSNNEIFLNIKNTFDRYTEEYIKSHK